MPVILAIDSSGDTFSAAVNAAGSEQISSKSLSEPPHTAYALPLIETLLGEQNLTLGECDAFAFAAGPGKFSALRLTCTISRTFAYAQKKPLLAVPGFAALAQENYGNQPLTVKCALPAQQQHVYFGVCRHENGSWRVQRTALYHCANPPPAANVHYACGAGYPRYPQLLGDATYCNNAPYSSASAVWQLAATMLAANEVSDPLTCQPFYLRDKVAETVYQRQCKQKSSKN